MFKNYYHLAKPGIVYGNVFTTLAAFLFASRWHFSFILFGATIIGMVGVIGSACVINNYFDKDIDAKMSRTQTRPLVTGSISTKGAFVYALLLALVGFGLLSLYVNTLTALVALAGFLVYVCVYTPLKHRSGLALFPGAVAGAMPMVAGYTTVANHIDSIAWILFAFMFVWQLPHFMGIAYYRFEEYRAADIPLLIKKQPSEHTKQMGRLVFFLSLIVLVVFCVALALAPLI